MQVCCIWAGGQVVWYVDDDGAGDLGPGDPLVSDPLEDGTIGHPFDAIQEGIDAAGDGDVVLVAYIAGKGIGILILRGRWTDLAACFNKFGFFLRIYKGIA